MTESNAPTPDDDESAQPADPRDTDHRTGEDQAAANVEDEPAG